MYVIVAGGGKVGFYLAKELVELGHEVLVIEADPNRANQIETELGSVVTAGDACEARILREAGAERADLVAAVTGDDEDNLVICQVAKSAFRAGRVIARINNPKNAEIFRRLGIDDTVSATDLILSVIEQEIPEEHLKPLLHLRFTDVEVVEVVIEQASVATGHRLGEIQLPSPCTVPVILRDGTAIFPGPDTMIQGGDGLIAFTTSENEPALRKAFLSG
ncbi:MAG TPA: TrkA family potassium uptake protein [Chloroflexota bacterium]